MAKQKISLNRVVQAVESNMSDCTNIGFCTACGNEQGGCEPDARNCECEECGARKVFGAEELLMMLA